MQTVVVVKALRVTNVLELHEHIVNHSPVGVEHDTIKRRKGCQLSRRERRIVIVVLKELCKALRVMLRKGIDKIATANELGLVHVERRSKHVHVKSSVHVCGHNDSQVSGTGSVVHTRLIVVRGHDGELVSKCLSGRDDSLVIRLSTVTSRARSNGGHAIVQDGAANGILDHAVIVIVKGRVHGLNDARHKVGQGTPRHESGAGLLLRNRVLVENLIVQLVEGNTHVGVLALKDFLLGNIRIEGVRPCKVDKNLLDRLTDSKFALLEVAEVGIPILRLHNRKGNAVKKGVPKCVSGRGVLVDDSTNLVNRLGIITGLNSNSHA